LGLSLVPEFPIAWLPVLPSLVVAGAGVMSGIGAVGVIVICGLIVWLPVVLDVPVVDGIVDSGAVVLRSVLVPRLPDSGRELSARAVPEPLLPVANPSCQVAPQ
jgi:hypothetical protein